MILNHVAHSARTIIRLMCICMLVLTPSIGASTASAADTPKDGHAAFHQLADVYGKAKTYYGHMDGQIIVSDKSGKVLQEVTIKFDLAIDKPAKKLSAQLILSAGETYQEINALTDGKRMTFFFKEAKGTYRHLNLDAPDALNREFFVNLTMVMQTNFALPLLFMASAHPEGNLVDGKPSITVEPLAGKGYKLKIAGQSVKHLYEIGSDGALISATSTMDGAESIQVFKRQFKKQSFNQKIDAKMFATLPKKSEAVGSFDGLLGRRPQSQQMLEGQKVRNFKGKYEDGAAFDLAQVKEDIVLLDFWATYCGPCMHELPKLQQLQAWAKSKKYSLRIIPVNVGNESARKIQAARKRIGLTLPGVIDNTEAAAKLYRVMPIPHTVMIHKGKIIRVQIGTAPFSLQQYKAAIKELAEEKK